MTHNSLVQLQLVNQKKLQPGAVHVADTIIFPSLLFPPIVCFLITLSIFRPELSQQPKAVGLARCGTCSKINRLSS